MFKQITLSYSFSDLEPYIDTLTMETHYLKHHATYTKNLNDILMKANIEGRSIEDILANIDKLPKEIQMAVRNNGGGYYNHNLYFQELSAKPKKVPTGQLLTKINSTFGSLDSFKETITKAALGQFGSGWAWLSSNKNGELSITASPNQDNPIFESKGVWTPILGIDVWEHAYYLKHKNLRGEYLKDLFEVIDWNQVEKNYDKIIKK